MENTAKNFALQLGSLASLYVSLVSLLILLFGIINVAFPDATEGYWQINSASSGIRFSIAMLIVFFPTYIAITRVVNKTRRKDTESYLLLTKWLIYLSLLIAGAVILGDLVAILNAFLNGEIVTRFVLKALSVFVVIGSAFIYYILGARNYWQTHEKKSIKYGAVTTVVVFGVLIIGFFYIETPVEVREKKIDNTIVRDLQNMQWKIEDYYRINDSLPETLSIAYGEFDVPKAPEDRREYSYNITDTGFELCAEFRLDSKGSEFYNGARPPYIDEASLIKNPQSWDYKAGYWCFSKVVSKTKIQIK